MKSRTCVCNHCKEGLIEDTANYSLNRWGFFSPSKNQTEHSLCQACFIKHRLSILGDESPWEIVKKNRV